MTTKAVTPVTEKTFSDEVNQQAATHWHGDIAIEELARSYTKWAWTREASDVVEAALVHHNNKRLVTALDLLSQLCHKLACKRLDPAQYPYQGERALYEHLDLLRGFYRDVIWGLEDEGVELDGSGAFLNVRIASKDVL